MFIDEHRDHLGVEAICMVLPIAPSVTWQAQGRSPAAERALITIINRLNWIPARPRIVQGVTPS